MKRIFVGLLLILLIFTNCRRKSGNEVTLPLPDTTELPPCPPGTVPEFIFLPQKQNLDAENIGIVYKESDPNIFYVNICGGNNVYGVTFDFDYDSSKLTLKNVTEGDFFRKDGIVTKFMRANSQIVVTRIGQVSGASGDGTICIIELEAENKFDSLSIGFKNQRVTDRTLIEMLPANNWFGGVLSYK
ncbi:MAG: cohesin domain-containing protein [bacterium]